MKAEEREKKIEEEVGKMICPVCSTTMKYSSGNYMWGIDYRVYDCKKCAKSITMGRDDGTTEWKISFHEYGDI